MCSPEEQEVLETPAAQAQAVLAAFDLVEPRLEQITLGNINLTYLVATAEASYILQRLNPIFGPKVHEDIEAVTAHLVARGLCTPRLVRNRSGHLWTTDARGQVWRVLTFIPGRVYSSGVSPALCREGGRLLGRFHLAVADLEHVFSCHRPGVHDTPRHLRHLREVLASHNAHPAYREVLDTGRTILDTCARLPPLEGLPARIVHGDPKLNNIVFSEQGEAVCLIDLDTFSHMTIPVELGDALRSWCNPTGEDEQQSQFDVACCAAALRGYADSARTLLSEAEITAIPTAIQTIALELAARFASDALEESYFAWNRHRFATAAEHNLARARSQLSLAHSIRDQLLVLQEVVRDVFGPPAVR